jgi:GAF domain-containing protein
MSQRNRLYERIKTLFSKTQSVAPDSPLQTAGKMPAPRTSAKGLTGRAKETQAQQSAEGIQDIVHGTGRGYTMGFAYNQEKMISLEKEPLPPLENALCVPLMVAGTTIGTIQAAGNETGWTPQEIEIVSAVAAQLARHLENLGHPERNEQ